MERVKRILTRITYTEDHRLSELPLLHRSLLPLLSFASSLYTLSLFFRHHLYLSRLLPKQRLPVPVISVGNLTWGGNGKTPMVEFIGRFFAEAGIPPLILTRVAGAGDQCRQSDVGRQWEDTHGGIHWSILRRSWILPLILTRGYAGGDEAKMLQRHLLQTSARIGVGASRGAIAASIFDKYGYMDSRITLNCAKIFSHHKCGAGSQKDKIGVVILDDGMQHWSLSRDLEIVMVNGLMPWGNSHLIPRGPLREPFSAFSRADIVVIHHADLVSDEQLKFIESRMQKVREALPIFFSQLAPSCLFEVKNQDSKLPLSVVYDKVVLCVSAIGFPDAFVQRIREVGPLHFDRLDFSDHHFIQADDIEMIRKRVKELEDGFEAEAIVVVTEKDYDRDPTILKELDGFQVLVLCSSLKIMPFMDREEEKLKTLLKELLINKCRGEA